MLKIFRKLFTWIWRAAILFGISGQANKPDLLYDPSLPPKLSQRLDSLRGADDLAEWLYTYRDYVNEDPENRIALLAKAQLTTWRTCRTDNERTSYFYCLASQGYNLLFIGNILHSIDAYEQAYRFYINKPIPGVGLLEYVLKPLGNNYTRLGDYDRALFIQKKSLDMAEQKDSTQVPAICHNLATTCLWKGDLDQALFFCEKGLKLVNKKSALYGLLYATLSEVNLKSNKIKEAQLDCKEAIKILKNSLDDKSQPNAPYWLSGAYQNLGGIYAERNQPAIALQFYEKANALIDQYYKGRRKREKAQVFVLTGHALMQLKEPKKAMEKFQEALCLLLPSYHPQINADAPSPVVLYGENTLLDALRGKADCLVSMDKKEESLQYYLLLFSVEQKLRYEFFSIAAKQQQQKEDRQWMETAIAVAWDLWKKGGKKEFAYNVLQITEMSKAQLLLDEMQNNLQNNGYLKQDSLVRRQAQMMQAIALYEREAMLDTVSSLKESHTTATKNELQYELSLLQKQLKEKYPGLNNPRENEQLSSGESILETIVPHTTVIEFFTGEKSIYTIIAEKGSILQINKHENATGIKLLIKSFISTWFQEGPRKMMNDPRGYQKEAYLVYHSLVEGISFEKQPYCLIIPDGIIGYIPFDALLTDTITRSSIGQYSFLIKKADFYYCYSLQTWKQLQKVNRKNKLFAGFFITFDSNRQASLPAVKKEYEVISNIVDGEYFLEQKASLRSFNEKLGDANLLHISTHSYLMEKENVPVLQLADDKFYFFELYGRSFQPQLVVLSACRTGHGLLAEGEGIISLARGFMATGVGGIVAGLWNMNDETTAKLVGDFYKGLAKGNPPATALHNAKIKWLEDPSIQESLKLPYFWAGMIYSGNNEPVYIERKKSNFMYWWLIILLIPGSLLVFIITRNSKPIRY